MEHSESDLEKVDAELRATERRREWMSDVVSTLKEKRHHARVAETQLAEFAAMLTAMRKRRREIEAAIVAERERSAITADDRSAQDPI